jgi:hypothetical protein
MLRVLFAASLFLGMGASQSLHAMSMNEWAAWQAFQNLVDQYGGIAGYEAYLDAQEAAAQAAARAAAQAAQAASTNPSYVTGSGAVAGWVLVGVVAGIAIYKSGQYYYYVNQMVYDVGSQPANTPTDYENPGNYWTQFYYYYVGE